MLLSINGAAGGRIRLALSPHGTDSCGPDLLRMIRKLADEQGCLITTHLSQSPDEGDLIRERHGCTPTEYLERMGVLGPNALVAHCIYASDDDLAILARTKTTCTLLSAHLRPRGRHCLLAAIPVQRHPYGDRHRWL